MAADTGGDEQVARRTTVAPRTAPALEPDALAVAHTRRQPHLDLARPALDAGAVAGGARVVDHVALARTVGARLREAEEALVVVDDPPAVALRAHVRGRARLGAASVAGRASRVAREVDRGRQAPYGVVEVEVQLGLEVRPPVRAGAPARAAGRAPPAAAVEQATEHVAQVADVLEPEGARGPARAAGPGATEHAAHRAQLADLVVFLALSGVADDVVGRRHLLEALLGGLVAGVRVGVVLAGQLAVRALDVLLGGRVAHPEDAVVVLLEPLALGCHVPLSRPFPSFPLSFSR
jgi:hypothetical protein